MPKGSKENGENGENGENLKKLFDDNFLGEQFSAHLYP